ncbi:MAG TPA: DUF695 domain-containing protein, partial [Flavisolibacter sp.]|nr:DUF695 domain-containing protein [Flavisolibacter sp.]
MRILKSIFKTKDAPIQSYEGFWNWFLRHEKAFYKVVKTQGNIEKDFFDKLSPKLHELKDGFLYLTGMYDDDTVELVITADGTIKNIVFVEELIEAAPHIEGWKFTALKPALDKKDVSINMAGYEFNSETLHFYANDHADYPDEVDITIIHNDFTEENKTTITNGIYIFLDNYLGELDFAVNIDNLEITERGKAGKELIPIEKLKDYLTWRQKEFVEKYEGLRHNTDEDEYSVLEAELESGNTLIAAINTELLKWDSKASHPWIVTVEIPYDGSNNNGMPDEETYQLLNDVENSFLEKLKDSEGYLNIGRQTAKSTREIYFA